MTRWKCIKSDLKWREKYSVMTPYWGNVSPKLVWTPLGLPIFQMGQLAFVRDKWEKVRQPYRTTKLLTQNFVVISHLQDIKFAWLWCPRLLLKSKSPIISIIFLISSLRLSLFQSILVQFHAYFYISIKIFSYKQINAIWFYH